MTTKCMMKSFLNDVCESHSELKIFNVEYNSLFLRELTEDEFDNFFRLSIGYFDFEPENMNFWSPLEKIQIYLRTKDYDDKERVAEIFIDSVKDILMPDMQDLLNESFDEYMRTKEDERLYEQERASKMDEKGNF